MAKPKKKKPVGRPALKLDADIHVHCDKTMREAFLVLCTINKPRTDMSAAFRNYMVLCLAEKTILGL